MKEIHDKDIEQFFEMLKGGNLPQGILMTDQPTLNTREAFSILWYIQEHLGLLDSRYELCDNCESLFNSHSQGSFIDQDSLDDHYYIESNITKATVRAHIGKHYCCQQCEFAAMRQTQHGG